MKTIRRFPVRRMAIAVLLALVVAACDWRGPEPTEQLLTASTGPFAVGTVNVPTSAGFGGGTIYYPSGEPGPFGVISISPGFTETQTAVADWGPRLASHGFVVVIINTSNVFILPDQRSTEQRQALDYVVAQGGNASSPVFGRVDGVRRAVAGHSMGGGASLISAQADHSLRAVMPLAPWNGSPSFPDVASPTMIFACQSDSIAPVASHASPMYESIPASAEKQFLSVAGGDHFCANSPTGAAGNVGKFAVAFFKRFVDGDVRYDPWVCGASMATAGTVFNEVRTTCPL